MNLKQKPIKLPSLVKEGNESRFLAGERGV